MSLKSGYIEVFDSMIIDSHGFPLEELQQMQNEIIEKNVGFEKLGDVKPFVFKPEAQYGTRYYGNGFTTVVYEGWMFVEDDYTRDKTQEIQEEMAQQMKEEV